MIESRFDAYVGKQVYEEWARQKLVELGNADQLAFVPDEVGRAWNPRAKIDVLAVNWKEQGRPTCFAPCRAALRGFNARGFRSPAAFFRRCI